MPKFFFNSEGLPTCDNINDFLSFFSKTLHEFVELLNDNTLNIERFVVTEKHPSEMIFGDQFTLQNAIEKIENLKLRTIAYSYFRIHPLEQYVNSREINLDRILEQDCMIQVNGEIKGAFHLSMVANSNEYLFTVALSDDLKKDLLLLIPQNGDAPIPVKNLFGETSNTDFIKKTILENVYKQLSNFDKLKTMLDQPYFSNSFEREFIKLGIEEQNAIINEFLKAKNRGLASKFYPDAKLIKDVSLQNGKCAVYELRIYTPTAIRVYFNEDGDKVWLSQIGKKSNPDQNKDIKAAESNIIKMKTTNRIS